MRKFAWLIILQFTLVSLSAQDAVHYFGADNAEVFYENKARYKKTVSHRSANVIRVKSFVKEADSWKQEKLEKIKKNSDGSWEIKSSGSKLFAELSKRTYTYGPEGKIFFNDYVKGRLIRSGTTASEIPLMLQDTAKLYYPNGNLKSVALYDQNRLIGNQNWHKNGNNYIDNIHYYVDKTPEHSNGQVSFKHYMLSGIQETEIDLTQISDMVLVGMVVMADGKLDGLHLKKGTIKELNSTIIDLIREMPGQWVAAEVNGKPVNYYMELPFNFQQSEKGFDSLELSSGFIVWD